MIVQAVGGYFYCGDLRLRKKIKTDFKKLIKA